MTERQHLPPCCQAIRLGKKDTPKGRFKTELSKFAVTSQAEKFNRLMATLTEARSALQLDRLPVASTTEDAVITSTDEITAYVGKVAEYLSLLKGFTLAPNALATGSDFLEEPESNPIDGDATSTGKAILAQPLMHSISPPSNTPKARSLEQVPGIDPSVDLETSRSSCLSFCQWSDIVSNANLFAPNARVEMAQALLATGLFMMDQARLVVDKMLSGRVNEIVEQDLKVAYQLYLHAAGVLEACLRCIDVEPRTSGSEVTDLSEAPHGTDISRASSTIPTEDMMEKWRLEQLSVARTSSGQEVANDSNPAEPEQAEPDKELAALDRIPDLVHGRFPQMMAWVSMAAAQEMVILRGISRGFVDFSLMAKLAMDVSSRYKECHSFASRHLPCATSSVAGRMRLYCSFKDAYYVAVSCYFQGAACMEVEDGRHCAQAIANFTRAKMLIQESNRRKMNYDAKVPHDEKDRQFGIKTVYMRTEQIIQRDLDIMTHRNDSVYYERIPDPESPCPSINLVRPTAFPEIEVHSIWHDPLVATCLHARSGGKKLTRRTSSRANGSPSNVQPAAADKPKRSGCCKGCVIS